MAEPIRSPALAPRTRFLLWSLLYAAAMLYVSTAVNLGGLAYRKLTFNEAVARFLETHYWNNGSDQRADWTANLLLALPLGFLIAGTLWPRKSRVLRLPAAVAALLISLAYVLAVKFVQVFFPRTVSINYIIAQSIGALIGVLLFGCLHAQLARAYASLRQGGRQGLIVLLAAASVAMFAYTLVPFDFVISAQDVQDRLTALPTMLFAVPGVGRAPIVRLALLVGAMLPAAPMGTLLEICLPRRPLGLIATAGLLLAVAWTVPVLFIMGAAPSLITIPARTAGFVAGAWFVRWIMVQDLARLRPLLRRGAVWAWPPYLLALLAVNGLLKRHWRNLDQAMAALVDPRHFIPLWTYYNISKAQAVASLVVHVAMYLPIGVLIWATGDDRTRHPLLAALAGLLLSAVVEAGRWFQPTLVPDINNLAVGALAAAFGTVLAPFLWRLLLEMTRERAAVPRRASLARYL